MYWLFSVKFKLWHGTFIQFQSFLCDKFCYLENNGEASAVPCASATGFRQPETRGEEMRV